MAEPILLARCTWPEVERLRERNAVVLVPVGANEQHGRGIALATDTISADALCQRAAAILGDRVAVAPPVPYGVSWHHLHFPGTITLTSRTLATVLTEIVASLAQHGLPRVAIVNGHGGNSAAVALAVEEASGDLSGTRVIGLYGYAFLAEAGRDLLPPEAIGHGGGDEAAVVMAAAPDYARPEDFCAPETVNTQADLSARLRAYGGVSGTPYDQITRNGATGDTRAATGAIGEQILARAGRQLAAVLEEWIVGTTPAQEGA